MHAHIFGHPRGAWYFEQIVRAAVKAPDIWVGTRAEIADHVLAQPALYGGQSEACPPLTRAWARRFAPLPTLRH